MGRSLNYYIKLEFLSPIKIDQHNAKRINTAQHFKENNDYIYTYIMIQL